MLSYLDHRGVTNTVLVEENDPLAIKYKKKSVAEQNSFDIAWELFMSPAYKDMRAQICATPEETQRLRQILVNVVMATGM